MRYEAILAIIAAAAVRAQEDSPATGELGDAEAVTDNPAGAVYKAVLPGSPFSPVDVEGNVKGYVMAASSPDGTGVVFTLKFDNLPTEGGPFGYHIHVAPVPEDGNCTQTLAHLDPYIRGEDPVCDPEAPETCQVGDMSGKYGKIESGPFTQTYTDPYATLEEGLGAYFGNRSIVLHYANKTRITCANFEPVALPGSHEQGDDCDVPDEGGDGDNAGDDDGAGDDEEDTDAEGGAANTDAAPTPTTFPGSAVVNGASLLAAFAAVMFAL